MTPKIPIFSDIPKNGVSFSDRSTDASFLTQNDMATFSAIHVNLLIS